MRSRNLVIGLLTCWFVLAAGIGGVRADEWYQGQRGNWVRAGNTWVWRSSHGDQWYQGQRGHWYAMPGGQWYWLSDNGAEYRHGPGGWEWAEEHHHHKHKHHHHHDHD